MSDAEKVQALRDASDNRYIDQYDEGEEENEECD